MILRFFPQKIHKQRHRSLPLKKAIVSFLAITYSRVPLNANRRSLVLVPRQSIVVLLMLLLRPAGAEFTTVLRDEVDIAKSALGQVNAMIAEMQAMDDPFEYANNLGCLKDSKRILGWKIVGLNKRIEDTEGEIRTFEGSQANTPYPEQAIRHMRNPISEYPRRFKRGVHSKEMNDPDITMKDYIRLETEKVLKKGKVYNWETATYGKISSHVNPCVSSILVGILPLLNSSPSYLRTAISNYGVSLGSQANTPYQEQAIRDMRNLISEYPRRFKRGVHSKEMNDPDITMKEYIRLETEKVLKKGKVYNWETATYGKIRLDILKEDIVYQSLRKTLSLCLSFLDS
nr:hypothetical protein [Tanacetum cinerariifolium]